MNDDERFEMVAQMRYFQAKFFRTRSPEARDEAMRLERQVDQMLKQRKEGPGLFDRPTPAEQQQAEGK